MIIFSVKDLKAGRHVLQFGMTRGRSSPTQHNKIEKRLSIYIITHL